MTRAMETDVPADASPAECPYCDRAFPEEEYLTLHVGLDHADECTTAEREAFEAAQEDERDALRRFQVQALGLLVLLYFGLLITYAVVT